MGDAMQNSFEKNITLRFIFIYILTMLIIVMVSTFQYYSLCEYELSYNDFLIKPVIAFTLIILFIYIILNRVIKKHLIRLQYFESFLYSYLQDAKIDKKIFGILQESDDEIHRFAKEVQQLMRHNIKILHRQNNFLKILEELDEVVLVTSQKFKIIEHNKPWNKFKEHSQIFLDYLCQKNVHKIEQQLQELKNSNDKMVMFVDTLKTNDYFFEVKIIHIDGVFGVIIRDITNVYKQHQEAKHMALHDCLTKLPNRSLLMDRLKNEIQKSYREKQSFALLFFDLNRFKEINDTYGHEAGDCVLIEFAKRVSNVLRASDTLSRIGGDEFIAIVSHLKNNDEVELIINKVNESLKEPVLFKNFSINISTSIGVSMYPDDAQDVQTLILQADDAMYKEKHQT